VEILTLENNKVHKFCKYETFNKYFMAIAGDNVSKYFYMQL